MSANSNTVSMPMSLDYSLVGVNSKLAIEKGLAEAEWYQSAVPRETLRTLLERKDGPALRDTFLWFTLIFASGYATYRLWGTWWAAIPYLIYAVLFASSSDSRWHETGHGTAFRSDWMNDILYEVSSFMLLRESDVWRWGHTRHHSDTIIVGRDPEISVPRPPDLRAFVLKFFALKSYLRFYRRLSMHVRGKMSDEEIMYIPASEFPKVYRKARIYLAIYVAVTALALATHSVLPLMYIGFVNFFGTWLMVVYSITQHTGLAENVLDHRLNCRTLYMNPIHRFLYWNMNYHIEHHMYPLVPYHALGLLHEAVKDDCPAPYPSLFSAWREIVPAVWKQVKDPAYHVKRTLPGKKTHSNPLVILQNCVADTDGWVTAAPSADLGLSDVLRFDHGKKSYVICRDRNGQVYALDGICTHGNVHLSAGLIKDDIIECPKHNGRFRLSDGAPARTPICRGLATYPVEERDGTLYVNTSKPEGAGARKSQRYKLEVVSNENVSTFIKELILAPVDPGEKIVFVPGDYLQIDVPSYDAIRFTDFEIQEPYASVWRNQNLFELVAHNPNGDRRNNYSIASNGRTENFLRFNVRIANPPPGQDCAPGVGSSYIFSLKPGDAVSCIGPFGDFHIKPTQREMVYIGGGAGMAPLRAHLSHLLENDETARKVSFWYGARSKQEIFYERYFNNLAAAHSNFTFHAVLSAPLAEDEWTGYEGMVHDVVRERYLKDHEHPGAAEYYLCGPPMMIKACTRTLKEFGVPDHHISFDEF